MAASAYSVLDSGLYTLKRAEVLYRVLVNGVASGPFQQFGDVDNFTLTITPTKVARFRKNAAVRTKAAEVITQVESALAFRCMQFSQYVRLMSVLGKRVEYAQTAATASVYTAKAQKGIHFLGKQDISNVALDSTPTATWTAGVHYKIVDASLGMVEIIELPATITEEDDVDITFDAAAISATSGRMKAQIAGETVFTIEIVVRDVGRNSLPQALHLYQVEVAPSGDVGFIGEDDFDGVDFAGSAVDTNNGIGVLFDLAA